jgi:hypothetical protein
VGRAFFVATFRGFGAAGLVRRRVTARSSAPVDARGAGRRTTAFALEASRGAVAVLRLLLERLLSAGSAVSPDFAALAGFVSCASFLVVRETTFSQ